MAPWNEKRWLPAFLSQLVVAALACSLLPGGNRTSPNTSLTQAAATITAAANKLATENAAATAVAAATSLPSPTLSAAPTTAPTVAAGATPLTAAATSTATPAPSAVASPTTATGSASVLDPCRLVRSSEVQALVGVPLGPPKAQMGGCVFADAATGVTAGLVVYALPGTQIQYFLQQYESQLKASGVNVDAAAASKLDADIQAGDTVASVNDLAAMALGQPSYKANKVDGLGSVALWSWNAAGKFQFASLVTAQPGALVGLVLVVAAPAAEADAQAALKQTASRILAGLPANFTVAGLQVVGSAPALDPCSLVNAADAEAILGAKATDGASAQGECSFNDAASQKLIVRVFALPKGQGATNKMHTAIATVLIGNDKAQAQVTADVLAGNLVAAVGDLGASGQSGGGRTQQSINGLGDAAIYFAQTLGGNRLGVVRAAKADVLVGVDFLLKPGDDAATQKAAVGLLTRILNNLPAKFTITGAP